MQEEIDIFKPGIAELQKMAEQYKDLTICGQCDRINLNRMKKDARLLIVANDVVVMTRNRYVEIMKKALKK